MTGALCRRCKKRSPGIEGQVPLPAELATLVRERICTPCWKEWQDMEIMVINELRLNFIDPAAQDVLHEQMKEFLELSLGPAESSEAGAPDN